MLENSNENINANTKLTVCKNTYLKTITAFQHISVQTRGKAVLWAKDKAKRQNHKNLGKISSNAATHRAKVDHNVVKKHRNL